MPKEKEKINNEEKNEDNKKSEIPNLSEQDQTKELDESKDEELDESEENEEDETLLDKLEEISASADFSGGMQEIVEAITPTLEKVAEGSQEEGLPGLVPVFSGAGDEDEDKDINYSVGKYDEKNDREKMYDEENVSNMGEIGFSHASNINVLEVGREEKPLTRDVDFVNPESGRMSESNKLEQEYVSTKSLDMQDVGRKETSPFDRKVEEKKYEIQ